MKIPITEEEINAWVKRKKRARNRPPEPSLRELLASGIPVGKNGRPLRSYALIRYYEQKGRQA